MLHEFKKKSFNYIEKTFIATIVGWLDSYIMNSTVRTVTYGV